MNKKYGVCEWIFLSPLTENMGIIQIMGNMQAGKVPIIKSETASC